jgi:hypothetical protein
MYYKTKQNKTKQKQNKTKYTKQKYVSNKRKSISIIGIRLQLFFCPPLEVVPHCHNAVKYRRKPPAKGHNYVSLSNYDHVFHTEDVT